MIVVLFDIDGTLLEARGLGRRSMERALSDVSGRPVRAAGVAFAGRTDPAIATDMLRSAGVAADEVPPLLASGFERYLERLRSTARSDRVTLLPGVRPVLERLRREPEVTLGLLTGNLRGSATAKLAAVGIDGLFRFGAYGSDHSDRYALPAVALERAAAVLGRPVDPGNFVVVGDTVHDVGCGREAGMRTVAVCTGPVPESELRVSGPDLLLPDLADPGPFFAWLGLDG